MNNLFIIRDGFISKIYDRYNYNNVTNIDESINYNYINNIYIVISMIIYYIGIVFLICY